MAVSRMYSRCSYTLEERVEPNNAEKELERNADQNRQAQNPVVIVAKALYRLTKSFNK